MQPTTVAQAGKLKRWAEVLDEMERALDRATRTIQERERAFEDYLRTHKAADPAGIPWPRALEDCFRHMQALQAIADKAAAGVADVDTALTESEAALRQWLAATEAARTKLATWLAGA